MKEIILILCLLCVGCEYSANREEDYNQTNVKRISSVFRYAKDHNVKCNNSGLVYSNKDINGCKYGRFDENGELCSSPTYIKYVCSDGKEFLVD